MREDEPYFLQAPAISPYDKVMDGVRSKISAIEDELELMEAYIEKRLKSKDWHGVRDAATDIEILEAKLEVLKRL